ncbi:MIR motif [Pseudocohnilembus persalinus]|uniref:MIR motif n=1 Tax=Pseudocohnilembus persalinus TaxID=266149 RepID=A0A0V0QX04_PSEPJ|nr:MIR motif [Pseudocohnilembus persalinus]|eukprot:KRX06791.1 MIR motif [Pseudocohnilembus persalinus]
MENKKQLTYGYTITLSPFDDLQSYIISDGFVKTSAQIANLKQKGLEQLYDLCQFKIYPSFSTQYIEQVLDKYEFQYLMFKQEMHEQALRNGGDFDSQNKSIFLNFDNNEQDEILQQQNDIGQKNQLQQKKEKEKQKNIEQRVVQEYKSNLLLFEKVKGNPIQFDKPIQLLHVASNKFLSCKYTEADYEKENFKVELQEFSTKNTHFKFLPSFSYQKRNDNIIEVQDAVYITLYKPYLGKVPYLNLSKRTKKKQYKVRQELLQVKYSNLDKRNQEIRKLRENRLKDEFEQFQKEDQSYVENDVVSEGNIEDIKSVQNYKTKNQVEQIHDQVEQNIEYPTEDDFQLKDRFIGGQIGIGDNYLGKDNTIKPKHIESQHNKKFIQVKEANISLESKKKWKIQPFCQLVHDENILCFGQVIWLHHIESEKTIVINKMGSGLKVKMESTQIQKEQFQNFEGNTNGLWVVMYSSMFHSTQEVYALENIQLYIHIKEDKKIGQITEMTLEQEEGDSGENAQIRVSEQVTDEDSFKIFKATNAEVLEQNFLISCFPILKKNLDIFSQVRKKNDLQSLMDDYDRNKIEKKMVVLMNCLQDIERFTLNKIIITNLDQQRNYGKPNKYRQKILFEQDLIQNLIYLLKYMAKETELSEQQEMMDNMKNLQHAFQQQQRFQNQRSSSLKQNIRTNKQFSFHCKNGVLKKIKLALQRKYGYSFLKGHFSGMVEEVQKRKMKRFEIYQKQKKDVMVQIYQVLVCICMDNQENQKYVYKLFPQFQYQAKYIPEAVNCIVNIIKQNELILTNLCDDIKMLDRNPIINNDYKSDDNNQNNQKSSTKNQQDQVIENKKQENQQQNQELDKEVDEESQESQIFQKESEEENSNLDQFGLNPNNNNNNHLQIDSTRDDNLIIFFMKLIESNGYRKRDRNLMRFFRTICNFNGKGLSVNQEQIYRMLQSRPGFQSAIFYDLKVSQDQLQISTKNQIDSEVTFLETMLRKKKIVYNNLSDEMPSDDKLDPNSKNGKKLMYVIEQLRFFADLALSRNYLWKNYLDNIFPQTYVVEKIFSEKLHSKVRSAFCNLALSQFIDHEPFNQLILPNKCRIHFSNNSYQTENLDDMMNIISNQAGGILLAQSETQLKSFKGIIDKSKKYLKKELLILEQKFSKFEEEQKNQKQQLIEYQGPNLLNNELTYNIIRILGNQIQFGIINILDHQQLFPEITQLLVRFLEYDYEYPLVSQALYKIRNDRFRINLEKQSQNKLFKGVKGFLGQMKEGINFAMGQVKGLTYFAAEKLGVLNKIGQQKEQIMEFGNSEFISNSLIGGLISLQNMLNKKDDKIQQAFNNFEVKIKLEICDQLSFMQKMRLDFLISNFLCWFDLKGQKLNEQVKNGGDKDIEQKKQKIYAELEEDLHSIIPDIFSTGISEIDEKYCFKSKNMMDNLPGLKLFKTEEESTKKKSKPKKFNNYISQILGLSANNNNSGVNLFSTNNNNNQSNNFYQNNKKNIKYIYLDKQSNKLIKDLDTLIAGPENQREIKSEILPSLLTVFYLAQDSELQDKVLSVIFKCFMQTSELFNYLEQIEVLFDEGDIQPYLQFQEKIQSLRILAEKSEVWLSEFTRYLKKRSTNEDIEKTIEILIEIQHLFISDTYKNKLEQTDLEPYMINQKRQKIFTFLQGHTPLINLVKDAQNQMAKILKQHAIPNQAKKTIFKLLRNMYKCLQIFCTGSEENQLILYNHISYFLDEISQDFGQFELLGAIFYNNKYLCENISERLIKTIINSIKEQGRQERFLQIFQIIMKKQDTNSEQNYIVDNQILVFKYFIPSFNDREEIKQSKNLLYSYIDKGKKTIQFTFENENDVIDIENKTSYNENQNNAYLQSTPQDYPFYYHAALLDIYITGVKGDEGLNLNSQKVKQILPLNYLIDDILCAQDSLNDPLLSQDHFEKRMSFMSQNSDIFSNKKKIIKKDDGFSILKPVVVDFIKHLYFPQDKLIDVNIWRNPESWTKLFTFEYERIKECNQYTDSYRNYIFNLITDLFLPYFSKVIDKRDERDEFNDYKALIDLLDMIIQKIDYFQAKRVLKKHYECLLKLIRQAGEDFFEAHKDRFYKHFKNFAQSDTSSNFHKMQSRLSDKQDQSGQYSKDLIQSINASQFNQSYKKISNFKGYDGKKQGNRNYNFVQDVQPQEIDEKIEFILDENGNTIDLVQDQKNDYWLNQENWKQSLEFIQKSGTLKLAMKNQISALGEAITNINKIVPDEYSKQYGFQLDQKSIITKMIEYLKEGIINKASQENMIYMLKLLIGILQNAEEQDKLEDTQNEMEHMGATNMFLSLVSDASSNQAVNDTLFIQLLEFMSKLLQDGNKKIQSSIYQYFLNHPETEVFFKKIHQTFTDYIEFLRDQQKRKKFQALDQRQNMKSELVMRLLKMLQLFCEGHYLELQNYLYKQTSSRTSYDLITIVVELLYQYSQSLNKQNYENIIKCLDTLTEFVQGPCYTNQETIIDSKFFEIAQPILDYQYEDQNISKSNSMLQSSKRQFVRKKSRLTQNNLKNQDIEKWKIERIKYKIMILVNSLLELNNNPIVVKRIMRSLPLEVLKTNLIEIYQRYRDLYGDSYKYECLKHADLDDPEEDLYDTKKNEKKSKNLQKQLEKQKKKYELITETGFYIFFLIMFYLELDSNEIDTETNYQLNEIKNDVENNNYLFDYKNSIFGQIAKLVLDIFGYFYKVFDKYAVQLLNNNGQQNEQEIEKQNSEILKQAIQFFNKNSAHIELVRDNKIEKVHFILIPFCHYLPKETKQKFNDNVNRDSIHSKITGLLEQTPHIIQIMKHEERLKNFFDQQKLLAIFANYVLYYLCYGALAFIATLYHPFFFAFHLTEFIIRFSTLRNILKSVWEPKSQLALTFLLVILFMYFFTVIAYIQFYDSYDGRCDSLILCFLESFDRTFKSDGGLGGWLEDNLPKDPNNYDMGRFFFDNAVNIIIVILLVEIFSGIIIDKFSDLRQSEQQKLKDIKEICFICGHTRELFDRKSDVGFSNHWKNDHYLWNYVFYLAFLDDKDKNEYTGIEQYVYDCRKSHDTSYFPIQKALVLKDLDYGEEELDIQNLSQENSIVKDNIINLFDSVQQMSQKIQNNNNVNISLSQEIEE